MVNIEDFIKRLEIILDYYGLNASSFADKIGVQRSSLSHLLSGRNKPSLDFILKIIDVFPEVDLYWMLIGTGSFPKSENETETFFVSPTPIIAPVIEETKIDDQPDLFSDNFPNTKNQLEEKPPQLFSNSKIDSIQAKDNAIDRIVIFYANGTFKTYSPE